MEFRKYYNLEGRQEKESRNKKIENKNKIVDLSLNISIITEKINGLRTKNCIILQKKMTELCIIL